MAKIAIFYGSTTGTTKDVAGRIARALGVDSSAVYDVAKAAPSDVAPYDVLVLGTSTWGAGDLQEDWEDFLPGLEALTLKGKKIAIFGCGDETMTDTFCNAVGTLRERLSATGAEFIGGFGTVGYTFDDSTAVPADAAEAVGLLLDVVNRPDTVDSRIAAWVEELKKEI